MKFFLPTAALDQHIAILGKTGSGKTFTAKGIVEHILKAGRQTCVIDPTGAWWGLRLAADGRGKGLDVVLLGGAHADIPIAERSGAAVARLVTEQGASVVIDTSDLGVGERTRWFTDFAYTLYRTIRAPLHLVIDEAHNFMPQGKVPDPQAGQMLHAGNNLMSGGRSRGIRGMLITQRPAKLHKDSLTCADTLIAMRMIAPQDRQAVKEWIDGMGDPAKGKEVLDSLAQLQRGEGWVWYPEGGHLERVKFPAIETYDSSAAPKHGAKAAPKVGAIDLAEVTAALAEAVKEAEANDPKLLRAEVARLKAELAKRPAEVKQVVKEVIKEVPVLKNGQLERTEGIVKRLSDVVMDLRQSISKATTAAPAPAAPRPNKPAIPPRPSTSPPRPAQPIPRPGTVPPRPGQLPPRQQRFLDAAAALHTLDAEVTRETVAGWVGVHPRGGSVGEELKALADAGLIDLDRGRIQVTEAGLAAAGHVDPAEAIARAKSGLEPRQLRFFEVILEAYPEPVTREAIAERFELHPRGGSLGEDLSRLVGRGLVGKSRDGYRARDFLFAGAN